MPSVTYDSGQAKIVASNPELRRMLTLAWTRFVDEIPDAGDERRAAFAEQLTEIARTWRPKGSE